MKRTERHHLKEDQMVTGFAWFAEFYRKWQREIMMGAVVIVIAAVIFAVLFFIRAQNLGAQSRSIGEVLSLSVDLDKKPENLAKLEKLADKGRAARLAGLELATYWASKGDGAKALTYLGRIADTPKDLVYYQAQDLTAQIHVRNKDYDKAIAVYKKIQAENPKAYPLDASLFHLAEAYEAKGDKKAALELYQKLQVEFAQSYYGYQASQKVGKLALQK